jgi:hypothetical protein
LSAGDGCVACIPSRTVTRSDGSPPEHSPALTYPSAAPLTVHYVTDSAAIILGTMFLGKVSGQPTIALGLALFSAIYM